MLFTKGGINEKPVMEIFISQYKNRPDLITAEKLKVKL